MKFQIKEIKQKINNAWRWMKSKFKAIVIFFGIVSVVMAAETQITILDTSPINYPLTANTNLEKLEFLYQSQETLRLKHNVMGMRLRAGSISTVDWQKYLKEDFQPKSQAIAEIIAKIGDAIGEVVIGDTISTTTGEVIPNKVNARQYYKETMKHSTNWQINLDTILK